MESETKNPLQLRWIFLLQGVLATIVGIGLLLVPAKTLLVFVLVLGGYWFVRGVATLLYLAADRTRWGWKLFVGLLGVIAGVLAMTAPLTVGTAIFTFIVFVIGFQALFSGGTEIYFGFRMRRVSIVLLGILSIVLGGALLLHPFIGLTALAIVVGGFALVGGLITIVAALRPATAPQPTVAS